MKIKQLILLIICTVLLTSCSMQGVNSVEEQDSVGTKEVNITLEGGSGKATVHSPVTVTTKDDRLYARLVWTSKNYDYVIVDGKKYENENPGGKSTFTVPVHSLDENFSFIADTVAMSKPHEIEYTIIWGEEASDNEDDDRYFESGYGDTDRFGKEPSGKKYPLIDGQDPSGEVEFKYAKGLSVKKYGDYRLISIFGVGDWLIVPEGLDAPEISYEDGSDAADITVIYGPFDKTYLVSTSAMDLVARIDRLGDIRFSPLRAADWHVDEVKKVMEDGAMLYAGKYRMPDYELLVSEGCDLAIENTMIYHSPDVVDKLRELGIPVMIETSSYEEDPLGRLEWIKLYGTLFDNEEMADAFFNEAAARITAVSDNEPTGKKVACFFVSETGMINVRKSNDYLAGMITLAGGSYVPDTSGDTGGGSSMNMQMEDFYAATGSADVLIYNSTIDKEITSVSQLVAKNALFADYEAVKKGNVYCLCGDFFQNPTDMAQLMEELREVLTVDREAKDIKEGAADDNDRYLKRLENR